MSEVLTTEAITKKFGGFTAIDNVDFTVDDSELRSIIGPNGAGKTTFFNMLSGTFSPSTGQILFKGENITGLRPDQIAERGLARSFQINNLFDDMSVMENIRLGVQAAHRDRFSLSFAVSDIDNDDTLKEEAYAIAEEVDLGDVADVTIDELAYGQKRKLEIAIALSLDPEVLLLDEPAAGLTTTETVDLVKTIEKISSDRTILLVEHDVELVLELSDSISVLHKGQIIAEGSPKEIQNDETVKEVYLGGA